MVDVNPLSVDTCTVYEVAPDESDQSSVGVQVVSVDPLDGLIRLGAVGTDGRPQSPVVKLHTDDHALVPLTLVALALQ